MIRLHNTSYLVLRVALDPADVARVAPGIPKGGDFIVDAHHPRVRAGGVLKDGLDGLPEFVVQSAFGDELSDLLELDVGGKFVQFHEDFTELVRHVGRAASGRGLLQEWASSHVDMEVCTSRNNARGTTCMDVNQG